MTPTLTPPSPVPANSLDFNSLAVPAEDSWRHTVEIAGHVWAPKFWDSPSIRNLVREVPAGHAEIYERGDGKFRLQIYLGGAGGRNVSKTLIFADLNEASREAEAFQWEMLDHAGYRWYSTGSDSWTAIVSERDTAVIWKSQHVESFQVKRNISPRPGVNFELSATYSDAGDTKESIRSFAEAAAIAITLPSFLSVLGAAPPVKVNEASAA